MVHKALVTPDALDRFYPDLADARFISPFITFHQRFSTNTSADWALAQPFRTLAHNGEINTIAGNRLWMRARAADATSLPGFNVDAPISTQGSDSLSLDDAIELLRHNGYSLAHAVTRLVPPAWERDRDLPPDVRAFYEFQSLVSEPWDGPSALVFADGRYVGAALDRNGFRPSRIVSTADDLIAVASEVGVLPADEHEIVNRGRLGPGDMIVVDVERGSVMGTNEIRRRLAFRRRYRRLVADVVRPLADPVGVDVGDPADGAGAPRLPLRPVRREAGHRPRGVELVAPAGGIRLLARRGRAAAQADDRRRPRGDRLDGRRCAAGGAVVAVAAVQRFLPAEVRAGHQPVGRSVPRIVRHVADDDAGRPRQLHRRARAAPAAHRAALADSEPPRARAADQLLGAAAGDD